ncbi:hypothetical protein GCM10011491_00200 [Brucella endophytica]|uniref:Uncharacterized protein n=1 Tax=Brucella endophytica TaxID=1963359 RepID=A0A916S0S3_9HYPH|nr:hypothetical protein GCM10011491_00200 [Brucella endophytica]
MIATPVHAGGSIETPGLPDRIRSIDYVGFDGVDEAGNPICKTCEAEKAAAEAKRAALEARRKRAREYMARMQGQDLPTQQAAGVDAMAVGALPEAALGDVRLRTGLD